MHNPPNIFQPMQIGLLPAFWEKVNMTLPHACFAPPHADLRTIVPIIWFYRDIRPFENPTLFSCFSSIRSPCCLNFSTVASLASKRSLNSGPANSLSVPSDWTNLYERKIMPLPNFKSSWSWAGVILSIPVPKSFSTAERQWRNFLSLERSSDWFTWDSSFILDEFQCHIAHDCFRTGCGNMDILPETVQSRIYFAKVCFSGLHDHFLVRKCGKTDRHQLTILFPL